MVGYKSVGAQSKLFRKSEFLSYEQDASTNVIIVHCFLHQFALCGEMLPPTLLLRLNQGVNIINFVKISALNTRLFNLPCEELALDCTNLLDDAETRWLSRGNVTKRVFELKTELLLQSTSDIRDPPGPAQSVSYNRILL